MVWKINIEAIKAIIQIECRILYEHPTDKSNE